MEFQAQSGGAGGRGCYNCELRPLSTPHFLAFVRLHSHRGLFTADVIGLRFGSRFRWVTSCDTTADLAAGFRLGPQSHEGGAQLIQSFG
jgi:hypothetical protein